MGAKNAVACANLQEFVFVNNKAQQWKGYFITNTNETLSFRLDEFIFYL